MSDFRCKCCENQIFVESPLYVEKDSVEIRIKKFSQEFAVTLKREDAVEFAMAIFDALGETKGIKFPLF